MRNKRIKTTEIHNFVCENCGFIMPLPRDTSNLRELNHIKNLYCPRCKQERKFKEYRDWEEIPKPQIFFISDLHLNHKNIIEYCNRPFKDVNKMNSALIKNWNSVVNNNDYVFFLGDFALGPKECFAKFFKCLNGKKIFLFGNHDHFSTSFVEDCGALFVTKKPMSFCYNSKEYFLSHAPKDVERNIHGHVHNNRENDKNHFNVSAEAIDYKPINIKKIEKYFLRL